MASNSKSKGLINGYTLEAYFNETGTDGGQNKSTVYVQAKLTSTNTNWSSGYASKLKVYWYDNKEKYNRWVAEIDLYGCNQWSSYTAGGTIDVYHNSDGSLQGHAYAVFEKNGTSSFAPNSDDVATDDTWLTQLDRYPVLNSGTNFTDRTNPVYNITAYGTYDIKVKLEAANATRVTRTLSTKNSTIYTLELTNEERKLLRSLSSNGKTLAVRETVCAVSNGQEISWSYKDYTMTIVKKPVKIMNNGSFVNSFPYIRVNGEWKEAKTYIRVDGNWKEEK